MNPKVTPLRYGQRDTRGDRSHISGSLFVELALAMSPLELAPAKLTCLRERVLCRAGEPCAPCGTHTTRATDIAWLTLAPGVEFRILRKDTVRGIMTAFVRMHPGAVFEAHDHPGGEQCYVLDGDIRIGGLRLQRGDLHFAEPGSHHEPTYSDGGALLVVHAGLPAEPCNP